MRKCSAYGYESIFPVLLPVVFSLTSVCCVGSDEVLPTAALTLKCQLLIKWDEYLETGCRIMPYCSLSPQALLQINMQKPASQLCSENLCVALGCGGVCACWGAAVSMQILFNETQQYAVAFLGA